MTCRGFYRKKKFSYLHPKFSRNIVKIKKTPLKSRQKYFGKCIDEMRKNILKLHLQEHEKKNLKKTQACKHFRQIKKKNLKD